MDVKKEAERQLAKRATVIRNAAKALVDVAVGKKVLELFEGRDAVELDDLIAEFETVAAARRGKPNSDQNVELAQAEECIIALHALREGRKT